MNRNSAPRASTCQSSGIPARAAEKLALPDAPAGSYELLSFVGRPSSAPAFKLEMIFCNRIFPGRFLLIGQDLGILGRNVLNLLPVLYDGLRLRWEVQKEAGAEREGNPPVTGDEL